MAAANLLQPLLQCGVRQRAGRNQRQRPAALQHRFAELRHRLLAGAFQHQIRPLQTLLGMGQRLHPPAKGLGDRRMMSRARQDPTDLHAFRQTGDHFAIAP